MSKIENLREKLHNIMDHGDDCEILATSQELDTLIVLYMKLQLDTRRTSYIY
ncbi:MAG: Spo0E like sporulation regulatory protein [Firmicutes bacterium ADurb.Bin419]|nr:MAG: Spo0E like sporulation regulatory protein [Firmicutes bacterium ADurb.Bin419]